MGTIFPDVAGGRWRRTPESLGYRADLEDGGIQAFEVPGLASERHRWSASWAINDYQTEHYLLEDHWHANKNDSFPMFDGWFSRWTDLAVGTGNGVLVNFDLPGKDIVAAGLVIEENGTPTVAYTFAAGAGANGADRITFTVAPTNGVVITCTWLEGRRRFPAVWYADSPPQPDNNEADLWQWSIELVEDPS